MRLVNNARGLRLNNNVSQLFTRSNRPISYSEFPGRTTAHPFRPAIIHGIPGQVIQSAPGEKYTQQQIKKQTISLATAMSEQVFFIGGTILWYMTSTNVTDQILVRIGDFTADQLPFAPGNGIEGLSFNKIFVSFGNAGQPPVVPGATATLVYFTDTPEAPARFF